MGKRILGIALLVMYLSTCTFSITYSAIIIDHKCTDLAEVPENWIIHARDTYKVSYGHTSHGSQIVTGMQTLNDQMGCLCNGCEDNGCSDCTYGFCDDYYYYLNGSGNPEAPAGVLSLWDGRPDGAKDLGNPNRIAWEAATRLMLDDPRYDNRNLVMWSWCGQVSTATEDDITLYLTLMNQLEIDYPDVTFIYMTGHLDGTGEAGNLHMRNEQIRNYCITNDKILFDFADIESYDPDGEYFLDRGADDGCYYNGGNWADEWCAANSASDLCATCSCAHSRPLNCNLKGRAFWWMMARLAGWEADPTTSTTTTIGQTTSSTTTSIESTTTIIISSTTSINLQFPDTTTTLTKQECSITIEPDTFELMPRQSLNINPIKIGDCNESDYEWSVESDVSSTIDQSGRYTAGINAGVLNGKTDLVEVVDHGNDGITAEATITLVWCPISILYGDVSQETILLREFRDKILMETPLGKEIIKLFYKLSPLITMYIGNDDQFKEEVKKLADVTVSFVKIYLE